MEPGTFVDCEKSFQMTSEFQSPASSCFLSINKKIPLRRVEEKRSLKFAKYPESVRQISAMLASARKGSAVVEQRQSVAGEFSSYRQECKCESQISSTQQYTRQQLVDSASAPVASCASKNSELHTCGSLYAKCCCKNDPNRQNLVHCYSECGDNLSKRNSLQHSNRKLDDKRFSSPEIDVSKFVVKQPHVCLRSKSSVPPNNTTIIKANVFLNHPEINFAIPVELPKNELKNNATSPHFYPEIDNRVDSHKAAVSTSPVDSNKDEEAEKFFKEFGILGPMGNGIGNNFNLRHPRKSIEEVTLTQIRRNSKTLEYRSRKISVNAEDYDHLKNIVGRLKRDLTDLENKYTAAQSDLHETKNLLTIKEGEVLKLKREVNKLKSVLHQTCRQEGEDILTSIQEQHGMAHRVPSGTPAMVNGTLSTTGHSKKQGVSAESSEKVVQASDIRITKFEKNFRSKQQIKEAIMDNAFLKNLDTSQIREIVDCMEPMAFPAGSYVLRQGVAGVHLFVSAEGEFEVIQDDKILGHMGPGKAFGELAILYNCTRTASIRALTDSKVWRLDRKVFQQIMKRTGLQRLQDNISFLKSVPLLANLSNDVLAKVADVLEVEFYPAGEYIIRQGANGDTFFIISSGCVKVTQRLPGHLEEDEIRTLQRGDYFGEQALLKEDCRTASVIALHPGVECLTLDRDSFNQLLGSLSEIKEKDYGDEQRMNRPVLTQQQEYDYIELEDLDVIATLGIGGFGRVELVQYVKDPALTFALKCLKKQHIVDTQQQDHIYSERNIMMSCRNPFICRLYRTYKDNKYVYMLLEACLGGEVWTILRDRGCFDDHTCRFIVACVLEAFDYLHSRGIVYRDLKPENLLLDSNGYVKLVDFGFSKCLGYSNKTWTFCGTPEYVAPETILNKGHDRAVDYWALGILMHELLTGNPPFTATDPMKTYNLILKGIDMIDFAKHNVGRSAQSLIKKLCRDLPSERLGYQRGGISDIKKHKWFQGFDWDGLLARTLSSPIQQPVRGPCDTSNFDCFGKDNDIPPDEVSDWDKNF